MAGGITLSPLSSGVSVAASGSASGGLDGVGAAADFGSVLSSALSIATGKNELGIAEGLGTQSSLKSEPDAPSVSSEDASGGQLASMPAPDVLAQLMVAMTGQMAASGQIAPHEVDADAASAAIPGRALKAKPAVLSADTAAVLRAAPEPGEHGAVADELAFAADSGLISSKAAAAKFADLGKSLPEKTHLVGHSSSQETQTITPQYSSALVENRAAVVGHSQEAVATVVGRPGWGEELGQKMLLMVRGNQQSAELQLNPPNLGPLEVRLSLQNDQASLLFVSAHSGVRDAINAALPRLSSMFAESGIAMGSVLVGDQSLSQQQQQSQRQFQEQSGRSGGFVGNGDDLAVQRFDLPLTRGQGWAVSMFV